MKNLNVTNLIFEAAVVNRLKRTGWQTLGDNDETLGQHTFMTTVISYILAKETHADVATVLTMSIFHDFHEARTGDFDKIHKYYATRHEEKANSDIFRTLDPELHALLRQYEDRKTKEARIVYEANILALLVELKILMEKGNVNAKEWFVGNTARFRLQEAKQIAKTIATTNSQDWWKDIRKKIHEEYKK